MEAASSFSRVPQANPKLLVSTGDENDAYG